MKKILNIFFYVFGLMMIFSCEPGRAENGDYLFGIDSPAETGGGTNVSKKLSKVTAVDSDGMTSVFNYNYVNGKLTTANYESDDEKFDYLLFYDNNLLSQLVIEQSDGSDNITTTLDVAHEGDKIKSASGTMESGGVEVMKSATDFIYDTTGKLKTVNTKMLTEDPEIPGTYKTAFTQVSDLVFSGSNISSWKMMITTMAPPPIVIPPIVLETAFGNYDTYKNPFATLPSEFSIVGGHFMSGTNSFTGLSLNNYRTVTVQTQGISDTSTYSYTYDKDGYPTKATSTQGTLTFEYQ